MSVPTLVLLLAAGQSPNTKYLDEAVRFVNEIESGFPSLAPLTAAEVSRGSVRVDPKRRQAAVEFGERLVFIDTDSGLIDAFSDLESAERFPVWDGEHAISTSRLLPLAQRYYRATGRHELLRIMTPVQRESREESTPPYYQFIASPVVAGWPLDPHQYGTDFHLMYTTGKLKWMRVWGERLPKVSEHAAPRISLEAGTSVAAEDLLSRERWLEMRLEEPPYTAMYVPFGKSLRPKYLAAHDENRAVLAHRISFLNVRHAAGERPSRRMVLYIDADTAEVIETQRHEAFGGPSGSGRGNPFGWNLSPQPMTLGYAHQSVSVPKGAVKLVRYAKGAPAGKAMMLRVGKTILRMIFDPKTGLITAPAADAYSVGRPNAAMAAALRGLASSKK